MDLSWLPSDIVKKLNPSLEFFVGFCARWNKKQEKQELVTLGRAVLEPTLPQACCVGRSQSEDGWSNAASMSDWRCWRMLGEEGSPAKMGFFIVQQKLDTWKDGIF